jgi:hypothetical protein
MRWLFLLALAASGCNAIFGLEPTSQADRNRDAAVLDADAVNPDARTADGAPLDASCVPTDDTGVCMTCTEDADCGAPVPGECTMPSCIDHACGTGPSPRDTLCNNQSDQCDGAGNCVDCTTSGGCGECCACFSQVCQPV